jgi:hypothetical protein
VRVVGQVPDLPGHVRVLTEESEPFADVRDEV